MAFTSYFTVRRAGTLNKLDGQLERTYPDDAIGRAAAKAAARTHQSMTNTPQTA